MLKAAVVELNVQEGLTLQTLATQMGWPTSQVSHQRRFYTFRSVVVLVAPLTQYLTRHYLQPKRCLWRAQSTALLATIQRAWEAGLKTPAVAPCN